MSTAIETRALAKSFGKTRALDGIDLAVREGSVYGLLGPNGAGKTTTIRVLATLLKPDSGHATVAGLDVVRDPDAAGRQVRTYSGGMRRRIDIGASLVTVPDILFLDEPTTGLDPRGRNQVWDLVRRIAAEGTTVLLTTQYLDEADRLAERMAVIDHGRVIAEGTSRDLKASVGSNTLRIRLASVDERPRALQVVERVIGDGVLSASEPNAKSGNGESVQGEAGEPLEISARVQHPAQAANV